MAKHSMLPEAHSAKGVGLGRMFYHTLLVGPGGMELKLSLQFIRVAAEF